MASKLCDSCKSATASLYCRADSAFLCTPCDSKIHAANKLASRHARVVVCEVCEQSPAHVTCKADAASLCAACDRDIHSANPLAGKHHRVPVAPFYDSSSSESAMSPLVFGDGNNSSGGISKEEEAEAASWLLPNPKGQDNPDLNLNTGQQQYVFGDPGQDDPYTNVDQVGIGMGYGVKKVEKQQQPQNSSGTDGVVPVQSQGDQGLSVSEGGFVVDFNGGSKGFTYGYDSHCFGQTVSSSSLDFGVVPEGSTVTEVSNMCGHGHHQASSGLDSATNSSSNPLQLTSAEREARVMRYREKKKNRRFEKTIRYASRKAYAEARPRIKGRFAKRSDVEVDSDARETEGMLGYGIVPSF